MSKLCTRAAAILLLSGLAASCGGAPLPGPARSIEPPAPSAQASADAFSTPEAALRALDEAEGEVARLLAGGRQAQQYAQPPAASAAPALEPGQAPLPLSPSQPRKGAARSLPPDGERQGPQALSAEPCTAACAALASMERAAGHVCSLAGAADDRCARARDRVKSASARVHAACPACGR